MATYAPSDVNTKAIPAGDGCAVVYDGKVTCSANAATADVIRFARIPAGTRIGTVHVKVTTAFGATAPSTVRLSPIDGSTAVELVAAGDTALATTGMKLLAVEPQTVAKDSYLECLLGTVGTGAAGVATAIVTGMANGAA